MLVPPLKKRMKSRVLILCFLIPVLSALSSFPSIVPQNEVVIPIDEDFNNPEKLESSTYFDWDSNESRSVGVSPFSVCIGDANNDGQNDIVTANNGDHNISILLWNIT